MKFVYIAGPYMGKSRQHDHTEYCEIDGNINQARGAAVALAKAGIGFFAPHLHSAHFEVICPEARPEYWYELDMKFLEMCDAILMLPGWQDSKGSRAELSWAIQNDLRVFYPYVDGEAGSGEWESLLRWANQQPVPAP